MKPTKKEKKSVSDSSVQGFQPISKKKIRIKLISAKEREEYSIPSYGFLLP